MRWACSVWPGISQGHYGTARAPWWIDKRARCRHIFFFSRQDLAAPALSSWNVVELSSKQASKQAACLPRVAAPAAHRNAAAAVVVDA